MTSAINYKTKRTKSNTYIFGKECIGEENYRSNDTLIINNKGLIEKFNSYADNRALGCPMGLNVNNIYDYKYIKDSVVITFIQTHCEIQGVNKECLKYAEPFTSKTNRKYFEYGYNFLLCSKLRNTNKTQNIYIIK